jgi:diguanylate cyclase (GGDEF)-like protein
MFAQGKEVRFGEEFPREWRTISRTESGQFRTDNGLFTFTTVRPLRQALERILGGRAEDINLKKKIKNSNYYWKLVSRASNYVFRSRSEQLFEDFGSILIIVISMAGLGSFFLALTQERRNRAEAAREQLLINLTKATQELDYKAAHDSLTGVLNRSAILDKLNAEIARSQRSDEPLGVILADVDHFKSINDKHGHLAGDKVLSHIAERISDSLRDYDFVGRYGGEEFIIIVPGCNQERTLNLAERLRESFEFEDLDTSEGRFHLTLSFGVTSITGAERSITMDGIIRAADEALYKAKREGRNSVEYNPVYEPNAA